MPKRNFITEYLRRIGKRGGESTSDAKAAAARENGKKGGRPKGSKNKRQKT